MTPAEQPPSYDREIHELYRERNTRRFSTPLPARPGGPGYGQLTLTMLLAVVVSLATATLVVGLTPPSTPAPVVERSPRAAASAEVSAEAVSKLTAATVAVFTARGGKSLGALDRTYLVRDALGQGLVLSSDGWVVTTQAVAHDRAGSYVVLTADSVVHPVETVVLDPVAPFAYLKVAAQQLTPTSFTDASELAVGQPFVATAFALQSADPAVYTRHLAQLTTRFVAARADLPASSESLPDRYLLDQELPPGSAGAPVFTTQGAAVGLAVEAGGSLRALVPLESLNGIIDDLFAKQQVTRPLLGLTYVQSDWLNAPPSDGRAAPGATLVAGARGPAVLPKGPAAAAGLREGDRIVSFGGDRLDRRSLSAVVQQYRHGARVAIEVVREGKPVTLNLTLGDLASAPAAAHR